MNTKGPMKVPPLNNVKDELLSLLLKEKGIQVSADKKITRRSDTGPAVLSFAQQRLWFLDQLGGTSTEYNMPQALRLRGELDRAALVRTIQTIVARHESLRTHFAVVDGEPVQVIEPERRIAVPVEDLRGWTRQPSKPR